MNGLEVKPNTNIENLIKIASTEGFVQIPVITPNNHEESIRLEIYQKDKITEILIDTHSSSWDINNRGQSEFIKLCKQHKNRVGNFEAEKRILEVEVVTNGVGYWLHLILMLLGDGRNIEEVRI